MVAQQYRCARRRLPQRDRFSVRPGGCESEHHDGHARGRGIVSHGDHHERPGRSNGQATKAEETSAKLMTTLGSGRADVERLVSLPMANVIKATGMAFGGGALAFHTVANTLTETGLVMNVEAIPRAAGVAAGRRASRCVLSSHLSAACPGLVGRGRQSRSERKRRFGTRAALPRPRHLSGSPPAVFGSARCSIEKASTFRPSSRRASTQPPRGPALAR